MPHDRVNAMNHDTERAICVSGWFETARWRLRARFYTCAGRHRQSRHRLARRPDSHKGPDSGAWMSPDAGAWRERLRTDEIRLPAQYAAYRSRGLRHTGGMSDPAI